jgi:hypothetical protein
MSTRKRKSCKHGRKKTGRKGCKAKPGRKVRRKSRKSRRKKKKHRNYQMTSNLSNLSNFSIVYINADMNDPDNFDFEYRGVDYRQMKDIIGSLELDYGIRVLNPFETIKDILNRPVSRNNPHEHLTDFFNYVEYVMGLYELQWADGSPSLHKLLRRPRRNVKNILLNLHPLRIVRVEREVGFNWVPDLHLNHYLAELYTRNEIEIINILKRNYNTRL